MTPKPEQNKWGLSFHHLGLAVNEPEPAVTFLTGLGYQIGSIIFDPLQNVNLSLCRHAQMPDVEIIFPAPGGGPLDKLLATRKGGLVYHMCFVSEDIDSALEALETEGGLRIFPISPVKKAVLFGGKEVSFYLVEGVGIIEIIDERSLSGER